IAQEVFLTVFKRIGDFEKRHERGSFRGWLREITRLKILEFGKRLKELDGIGGSSAQEQLAQLAADWSDNWTEDDEATDQRIVVRSALEVVRGEFAPKTFAAAISVLVDDRKPSEVAKELGMTPNAVSCAKFRVLRRLREVLATIP